MYKTQAWHFGAQQTFSEGGEQVIQFLHDKIHYFYIFTAALRFPWWFASEKPAQAGDLPLTPLLEPQGFHSLRAATHPHGIPMTWDGTSGNQNKGLQNRLADCRQEP